MPRAVEPGPLARGEWDAKVEDGDKLLARLQPEFRRAVEASAANIVSKIEPATADRLEGLADIAAAEAANAASYARAEDAYALAAELRRRARLLRG